MKSLNDFHADRHRADGRTGICKSCKSAYHRQWHLANREKQIARQKQWNRDNPERRRLNALKRHLRLKFGITLDEYQAINDRQGGVCAICGQPCASGNRLVVDHDHATGKVRGLLCSLHNRSIGAFGDDPEMLIAAAEYLFHHAANGIRSLTRPASNRVRPSVPRPGVPPV